MNDITISVIIPTRERETILTETLHKALEAIEGKSVEIIVINDGAAKLALKSVSDRVIFADNQGEGVTKARNLGARLAKGKILFFIDDDMWINKEIIEWIDEQLSDDRIWENAVYNVNWEYPPDLSEKLKRSKIGRYILSTGYNTMWGRMHMSGHQPSHGLSSCKVIGSCSLIFPKHLFEMVGGYNENILFQGEDLELSHRLKDFGISIQGIFDVTLYHNHADRLDLNGYLERIGRGYESQFRAEKTGILPPSMSAYSRVRIVYFRIASCSKVLLITLFKLLPASKVTKPLINRLLGTLTAMTKYRQWKIVGATT